MIDWNSFVKIFDTGAGFWSPIIWLIVILFALLIVYIIRSYGQKSYKKGTEQTKPFLSGNPEGDRESSHVKSSNLYWGFMESMRLIYKFLSNIHTGNVSDYVLWFVVIMGIFFIVIMGVN